MEQDRDAAAPERPMVLVVGGGIAGLATARRLALGAPGVGVTVVEAEARLGGKVVTERVDGFTVEGGPDSFLSVKPRGVGLCRELGLEGSLQSPVAANRRTFVLRGGRLHDLPEGLTGLIPTRLGPIARSDLLSPLGKARMALDFVLPPRRARDGDDDESLAAFVGRRLGREAYDRLIEPLMAGIYAGNGRELSVAATFPQLRRGELEHGGLIRGVLAGKRAGAKASAALLAATPTTSVPPAPTGPGGGGAAPKPGFLSPIDGTGAIVGALEASLRAAGVRILTGVRVVGLAARRGGIGRDLVGYDVTLADGRTLRADAVVLAAPAWAVADLLGEAGGGLDPAAATQLRAIPHVSSATVSVGYRAADLPHPLGGYGYVVPRAEARPVLACTWTSTKWAHRAPEGRVLLRAFVGRAGQPDPTALDDGELLGLARAEFREVLGLTAEPVLARVFRWPRGMPQYTLGHLDRVAAIEARAAGLPGLAVAGNAYRGVGLPDCIRSGEAAADAVLAALGIASGEGGGGRAA